VKRGSAVHEGELLAVLENRDLTAAAQENKGAYDQAEASYTTTTGASLPEEIQKAEATPSRHSRRSTPRRRSSKAASSFSIRARYRGKS